MTVNTTLQEYETAFEQVQHPSDSRRLALRSASGSFTEGDQGCDFFFGEIRSCREVGACPLDVYGGQVVAGAPLQATYLESGRIPAQLNAALPEPMDRLAGWKAPAETLQQPMYLVYVLVLHGNEDSASSCR
jgi:hypothetical protein